ncbi:MAG: competence/damage-inducible protein A [Planctomycetota bacterium]
MLAGPEVSGSAEIVAIGDELVHGHCIDTNSAWLAVALERLGIVTRRFHVVGDGEAAIADVLRESCARADVVLTTGGLGPTLDDRTREAAAAAAGVTLAHDEAAWQQILGWFERLQRRQVPVSNRRQATFPVGAEVLANECGTAPGFALRSGRALLCALPGVPKEMKAMFEAQVLPRVSALAVADHTPTAFAQLHVLGPTEAALGERLADFMRDGRNPAVGITASSGLLTVRVAARAGDLAAAAARRDADVEALRPLLGDDLVAEGGQSVQAALVERLRARDATIAVAESCTAGMLASTLADVPGVSRVLAGGVVTYSNAAKERELGVPAAMLASEGAVSEAVAAAMAGAVARRFDVAVGVGISGIAGPDGGTPDKPVGTVCFATVVDGQMEAFTRRIASLGRDFVRRRAVLEAMAALLRRLRP